MNQNQNEALVRPHSAPPGLARCQGPIKCYCDTIFERNKLTTYKLGIHYGYPKCCIRYFMRHSTRSQRKEREGKMWEEVARGSGFIPCPKCAKQTCISGVSAKRYIENLVNKNRKCEKPYKYQPFKSFKSPLKK